MITQAHTSALVTQILFHRGLYTNDLPQIDDVAFDALVDRLRSVDPEHPILADVGAPVPDNSAWVKIDHDRFMGSQAKVVIEDEFRSWASSIAAQATTTIDNLRFAIDPKLDGVDLSLQYSNGILIHAVTRGDGSQGEDILRNTLRMKGIPALVGKCPGDFTVRGQMMISKPVFELFKRRVGEAGGRDYKNPRNAVAGISRRLDGQHVDVIEFVAFDAYGSDADYCQSEADKYQWMKKLGFRPIKRDVNLTVDEAVKVFERYRDETRERFVYDIDGLVVRVDCIPTQEALGMKNGCPVGQIAWKFPSETGITKVVDILWQPSKGSDSGRITPKAVLEPVDVLGVTITNATLNNREFYMALGVSIGATVRVARANDVIPQIIDVLEPGTGGEKLPSECPTCGGPLSLRNKDLICGNAFCQDKTIAIVQRWVSTTDMLGVGEKIVESLVFSGKVKAPADLYKLTVDDLKDLERMGERSAQKVVDAIQSRRSLTLGGFIDALGIADVGESTMQPIIRAGFNTISAVRSVTISELVSIKGIGETTAQAIIQGLVSRYSTINELLAIGIEVVEPRDGGSLAGKSFCFTGAVKSPNPATGKGYTRKELQGIVVREGGEIKDSVGAGLSYLVQADANSSSSKSEKAKKLGTEIISDAEFLKLAGL